MDIGSIAFHPVPGTGDEVIFDALYIDMGYCSDDELGTVFDDNYTLGYKLRVLERTSSYTVQSVQPWTSIELDTPFWYEPSKGNLIIELGWPDGSEEFYSYDFPTPGNSLLKGGYESSTGALYTQCPHLMLEGPEELEQSTFASIKATFR
ncbi:hypothetical protein CSA37_12545 [Candidatus Fermentibacteria bacterium]|nr:MAG: hypothetical protein CSA37_12545 [Candidatus Fermentibacteria bacterium]